MKVGILYAIEDLKIQDVATPNSSEGQILIKVEACNICGTDIRTYHYGHKHIHFPRIAGREVSGEIVELITILMEALLSL